MQGVFFPMESDKIHGRACVGTESERGSNMHTHASGDKRATKHENLQGPGHKAFAYEHTKLCTWK